MKKIFLFFSVVFIIILLAGCEEPAKKNEKKDSPSLSGYFKSSQGDGFEIQSGSPSMFYQYDDASKTVSFAGEAVDNSDLTGSDGFITVKITNSGTWGKTAGEYLVVRWKNFTGNAVSESTPYKADGKSTMPTIDQAENEFTIGNGYYAIFGDYIKQ